MNLGEKRNLDAILDGMKDWPAPVLGAAGPDEAHDEERRWDERADAIVKAALEKRGALATESLDAQPAGRPGVPIDVLLAAPALAPEPGESGVNKMSDEKSSDDKPSSAPAAPPGPGDRKRTSLKEMAARASQSGARQNQPAAPASEAPAAGSSRPSVAPATSRPSSTPLPRPSEAGKDDSGVVDLNVVRASVTAQQVADAENARPAQQGLFDDDQAPSPILPGASPILPGARERPSTASGPAAVAARRSNTGPFVGLAIAALGIAAAVAIVVKKPAQHDVVATPNAHPSVTMVAAAPTETAPATVDGRSRAPGRMGDAPEASVAPSAMASTEAAPGGGDVKPAEPGRVAGPMPGSGAGSKDALAAKGAPAPSTAAAPTAADKPGDLQSEMARAVGPMGDKGGQALPAPEPAAGGARNQNIPEQPSQGSVQAAVGAVVSGAKACVAGADDVSRALVTFSSAGTVTSVNVSGWAAGHGKSSCVQGALKAAKVGPFSKPSFTVTVPIRP
jgi:hypothetical protein